MYTEKLTPDISNPYGYVYITTNMETGQRYCGKHKSSCFDPDYLGSGVLLKQAINQYGADCFQSVPIEWAASPEELHQQEVMWIQRLDAVNNPNWYNLIVDSNQYNQSKSPFKKFCQVNTDKEAMQVVDWLVKTSPLAYRILQFLVQNMDHYNAVVCSYKVLQEYFDISQPSVARAIKLLKEYQFIFVVKSGTSNIYLINKTLYWNSWGTNYANAKFGVNLIVALSEQEELKYNRILTQLQSQRECHLKDMKKLPYLSEILVEKMRNQPAVHYIPSSEQQDTPLHRSPIKLSPEEKRLLELML